MAVISNRRSVTGNVQTKQTITMFHVLYLFMVK